MLGIIILTPPESKLDFLGKKGVKPLKSAKNLTKYNLTQILRVGQDQEMIEVGDNNFDPP